MKPILAILLTAASVFPPSTLRADVVPASLFQDHAVLQQQQRIPVWGTASPSETVTVGFRDQKQSTVASADGRWRIDFAPMNFTTEGADLQIVGKNTVTIRDVLIGEVWLCSGQSNMEFPLASSAGGGAEAASAQSPLIRQFKVKRAGAEAPAGTVEGNWKVCRPGTAGGFSGVAYYFAKDLQEKLGVPVGIILSAVSGAQIEPWISEAALQANPALAPIVERRTAALAAFPEATAKYLQEFPDWEKARDAAKAAGQSFSSPKPNPPMGPGHINFPVAFYNGMIHPLIPYALRGVLWYQGESNTGRVEEYQEIFPTLITQWRKDWGQGDFPFYFVQLPLYGPNLGSWARFREAQAAALKLPHTGMVVTVDLGDANDLHPKNKKEVGLRLARLAEARLHNLKVDDSGPTFDSVKRSGARCEIIFRHAEGMRAREGNLQGFEVAGPDGKFVPAEAVIANSVVTASAPGVPDPAAVRYGWGPVPANLINSAGLPATPFRASLSP